MRVNFNHVNKIEARYKVLRLNVQLGEVLLLRLRATFHTWSLFYLPNPNPKGLFPVSRKFYARTCVKFTFANKIEAMPERSHVSVKVEPRSTSRLSSALFILPLFYLRD